MGISGNGVVDLRRVKYEGIRPAPGYPCQPDHDEKRILWHHEDIEKSIGILLTENYAIIPTSSVCGLYFAHPLSKYFNVGTVDKDQFQDYCDRKGMVVSDDTFNLI